MKVRRRKYKSGRVAFQLDLGEVNGRRVQRSFETKTEANEELAGYERNPLHPERTCWTGSRPDRRARRAATATFAASEVPAAAKLAGLATRQLPFRYEDRVYGYASPFTS